MDPGSAGGVVMCCDFHGHSRKKNVFMYACNQPSNDSMQTANQIIHMLPDSVASVCPIFNVTDCKFTCEKEKETTARIVLFKELGILNSYTLETTFFGSEYFKKPMKKLTTMNSFQSNQNAAST